MILRSLKQPNTETTIASAPLPTSSGVGGGDDDGTGNKFLFQNRSHPKSQWPRFWHSALPCSYHQEKSNANKQNFFPLTSKEAREVKLTEIQQKAIREKNKKVKEELEAKKQQESCKEQAKKQWLMIITKLLQITGRSHLEYKTSKSHCSCCVFIKQINSEAAGISRKQKVNKNKNTQ